MQRICGKIKKKLRLNELEKKKYMKKEPTNTEQEGCAREKRIRDNIVHISTLKNNFMQK